MQPVQSPAAFEAFHKAQTEFKAAVKDSLNPHFKSKFADFASVYDAVSAALHTNGLIVTQPIKINDAGTSYVETNIRHKDGTVIETSHCPIVCKVQNDPQAMGSAITYARRYSLASILCVVTDDDDAEAATARNAAPASAPAPKSDKSGLSLSAFGKLITTSTTADNLNLTMGQIAENTDLDDNAKAALKQQLLVKAKALSLTFNTTTKKFQTA